MKDEAEQKAEAILPCNRMCHTAFLTIVDGDNTIHMQDCPFKYRPAVAAVLREAQELRAEVAKLKARIVEQDDQTDRADEHTIKLVQELEEADKEREELRRRWQKMSDLAGHNLDEREKLIVEVAKLKAERAAAVIDYIKLEGQIQESWRYYAGSLSFGEFALAEIDKANAGKT